MFNDSFVGLLRNVINASNRGIRSAQIQTSRRITTAEMATALRPFYFAVHPDLFGRHPKQRSVNEESLKQLNQHLEASRNSSPAPKVLNFYVRDGEAENRDSFRMIKISLKRTDPKVIIKDILESCNLSTQYVDNIKTQSPPAAGYNPSKSYRESSQNYHSTVNSHTKDYNYGAEFDNFQFTFRQRSEREVQTLDSWLQKVAEDSRERSRSLEDLKEEVTKLQRSLARNLHIKEIRYDCGWNYEHYRGCLKTLERLANMHEQHMSVLKGRIVVFAPFTGVSLEGHIMLFTGDVLNNWLDFIKNIPKHDSFLKRIPSYEQAVSQVLCNIRIGRRKFMPKQQAVEYAGHLMKITTTLNDYLCTKKYPKSWPNNLSEYEIVIESEAGPLMVNPTGQLIAPATCPGFMLVDFITNNLEEAKRKAEEYNRNKYIEQELHLRCISELGLKSLTKDDSLTTDKMIKALQNLLLMRSGNFRDIHLNITNFYSLLTDGIVCIPWDFKN